MSLSERWKPSTTVAAVIERDGRFLLIEEHTPEGLRLNNPAGHLDPGESPQEACVREVLEETGIAATPGVDFDEARGGRFIRFSYAGTTADMEEALERLARWTRLK